MPDLVPVDHDPFAIELKPVDHDPFALASSMTHWPEQPNPVPGIVQPVRDYLTSGNYEPVHLPGTDPKDYLRELARNPDILAKNIEQATNFAMMGATTPLKGGPFLPRNIGPARPSRPINPQTLEEMKGLQAELDKAGVSIPGRPINEQTLAEMRAAQQPEPSPSITAYHGSPHDFDKFDISRIGTGEGAQAYGHGLYFAENEGVAKQYRGDLADKTYLTGRGEDQRSEPHGNVWSAIHNNAATTGVHPDISRQAATSVLDAIEDSGSIEKALKEYDFPTNDPRAGKAYQEAIASAQRMNVRKNPGKMYQVSIKADPEHFLDWDKPLSEQSEAIQKALAPWDNPVSRSAGEVYQYARYNPGKFGDVDAKLRAAGIPGIKYLDQGSRASGEGSRNYVVFDDKLIDILKKYGLSGIGALPAMGAYHFRTQQVEHDPFAQ